MITQYVKDPDETLDYQIDWSDWLGTDTISLSSWDVTSGITVDSSSNTTTTATIWLSGGTENSRYEITNTVTTADGRIAEKSFIVKITESELESD